MTDPRDNAGSDLPIVSGSPGPPLARTLDRRALERVLSRAAELQAMGSDAPEVLTEEQILDLGREVGLPSPYLRQAIAEERTRVAIPEEEGWVGRVFGASGTTATRVVPGSPDEVLDRLDKWMQKRESLRVKRRYGERMTWERSRGILAEVQRGFDLSGREYALARASEIAATVSGLEEGRSVVRLDADLEPVRAGRARASGITAGAGVVTSGVVATVGALLAAPTTIALLAITGGAALPLLLGGGGAWLIARDHLKATHRVQLALEQVLDDLERG
ncbi:MAG TPA: hypothetical protein VKZ41_09585 [Gemmatimonadales bacterium]|nr:hypothetical protein [Gemmatimonadales bacterium]